MQVVYAIIFYFTLFFSMLTLSLFIFCVSPTRAILHSIRSRYGQYFQSDIVKYIIILAFVVIGVILAESLFAYSTLKTHFRRGKGKGTRKLPSI